MEGKSAGITQNYKETFYVENYIKTRFLVFSPFSAYFYPPNGLKSILSLFMFHTRTHVDPQTHTHTRGPTNTNTHTHSHGRMHTHTHTHTHIAGEHTPLPPTMETDGAAFSSTGYRSRGHARTTSEISFAGSVGSHSSQATPTSRGQQGSAASETTSVDFVVAAMCG